ncbi:MAG: hypothetical protein ABL927_12100, partial [Bdellovibrionales bacterium]
HQKGAFILAKDAYFYHDEKLRSPMGRGILAGESRESLAQYFTKGAGQVLQWPDIYKLISGSGVESKSETSTKEK